MAPITARQSLLPALLLSQLLMAQVPIGQWRDHFSYLSTRNVIEGGDGKVYCSTKNGLFSLDPGTNETERYTKVNALSDVDITAIAWNTDRQALLVGYANGNLDMIAGGRTINISDIKRSSVLGDKSIHGFLNDGSNVLLACGFGIVKMDLAALEVRDTWFIGPNASHLEVYDLAFHQDSIYAATDHGLFAGWRNEPNLASFTQWHKRLDIPNAGGPFNAVVDFAGRLVANYHVEAQSDRDTVYYTDGGAWARATDSYGFRNGSLEVSNDGQRLVVAHNRQVSQYGPDMVRFFYEAFIQGAGFGCSTAAARSAGGLWVATEDRGLCLLDQSPQDGEIYPNGPRNSSVWRLSAVAGAVYASTGAVAGNYGSMFRKDGVHDFVNGEWRTSDQTNDPLIQTGANTYGGSVNDVIAIAVDPNDADHAFAGSWDDGVIEFRGRQAQQIFNQTNSTLQTFAQTGADNQVQVAGLDYDDEGNLWVTNSNCDSPISVRKKDGSWKAFTPGSILANNTVMADVLAASNGFKWIIRPRGNGMMVFYDGGTIDDAGDDQYQLINTFEHQGKLPSIDVYSMAEDKDGQIWVGTGKGVAVFYNPDAMFAGEDFDCQQILIEQDGNVQILLETESVSAIVVDGANRKWIGTQSSGVFLVSSDGTQQLQHFTVENSPLPSNNVICLAIEPKTGEVYVGTDAGIISYRSDATEGENSASCANVFPNPVKPSFTGDVAITGLVADSDVRITDIAGNLVYHTTSLGGQAMWPATDMSGNRVSTGVYLVLASDPTGASTCNTKVLVTR